MDALLRFSRIRSDGIFLGLPNDGKVPMKDQTLVLVEWWDAWGESEPISLQTVAGSHEPLLVRTLGWLLHEDERGVQVANEHYEGYFRGRSFIPRAMVKSVTPYALSKPRRKGTTRSKHKQDKKAIEETPSQSSPGE